jgi:hypothetical protein
LAGWPGNAVLHAFSRSPPSRAGVYACASARIPVADRGSVRDLELGKAVERVRVAWRPRLRFLGNRSRAQATRKKHAVTVKAVSFYKFLLVRGSSNSRTCLRLVTSAGSHTRRTSSRLFPVSRSERRAPPSAHAVPPKSATQGPSVILGIKQQAEAERIFHALADNGTVQMPLRETFWAARFGMLIDRFGIPWIINCGKAA